MNYLPTAPRVKRADGSTPGKLTARDKADVREALHGLTGARLNEAIARLQARYGVNRNRIAVLARRAT